MLQYNITPFLEIRNHPLLKQAGVSLTIKREDLNHPTVSGNKWWKLRLNLEEAIKTRHKTILTFGGAYSNHIYATAAATAAIGLKSIGIIRGDEILPLNKTLRFAEENGMHLHFVSRAEYRDKHSKAFYDNLRERFGEFFMIPEGGTNMLAVRSCADFAEGQLSRLDFDNIFLPVGTGGTMAGLICGLRDSRQVTGVAALKDNEFLEKDIGDLVYELSGQHFTHWSLLKEYHHGGYAKTTPELLSFMKEMEATYSIPLDHVYTGKLLWAIFKEIEKGSFKRGEKILMLHTGGLQGKITTP